MRVTMDEVNEVIKNYYEKMHPDFILTKRIVDNLGSITKLMGFRIPHIINSAHINEF